MLQHGAVCCNVLQCVVVLWILYQGVVILYGKLISKNLYQRVGLLYSKLIHKPENHYTADSPEFVPAPQCLGAQVQILKSHRATTIYATDNHYTADFSEFVPAPQCLGGQVRTLKSHLLRH